MNRFLVLLIAGALSGALFLNTSVVQAAVLAPELLQRDANGPRIASEALAILLNEEKKREIIAQLNDIRAKLGEPGAAGRAAQIACDML